MEMIYALVMLGVAHGLDEKKHSFFSGLWTSLFWPFALGAIIADHYTTLTKKDEEHDKDDA